MTLWDVYAGSTADGDIQETTILNALAGFIAYCNRYKKLQIYFHRGKYSRESRTLGEGIVIQAK